MFSQTCRSSHRRCSVQKVFLEISQNSQENTCVRVSFLIKLQASGLQKETLTPVFSCEFCETSKNTFFTEHLRTTVSRYKPYKSHTATASELVCSNTCIKLMSRAMSMMKNIAMGETRSNPPEVFLGKVF